MPPTHSTGRSLLPLLVAATFGLTPGARADETDPAPEDHSEEIEVLRVCLAQYMAQLDGDVEEMNRQLRRGHVSAPFRFHAAYAEVRQLREQLATVEASYDDLLQHAEEGELPGSRGAFIDGLMALESATQTLQRLDDLVRERKPWYPEGISIWTRTTPEDLIPAPPFDTPDPGEPLPPERLPEGVRR